MRDSFTDRRRLKVVHISCVFLFPRSATNTKGTITEIEERGENYIY